MNTPCLTELCSQQRLPCFALSSFLQAFVRNDGAPKLAMAGVISGGVTNVILDYVYIFYHEMGNGRCGAGDSHRNDTHGADPRKAIFSRKITT